MVVSGLIQWLTVNEALDAVRRVFALITFTPTAVYFAILRNFLDILPTAPSLHACDSVNLIRSVSRGQWH